MMMYVVERHSILVHVQQRRSHQQRRPVLPLDGLACLFYLLAGAEHDDD